MARHGEADDYYNGGSGQPKQQYPMANYNGNNGYQQPPNLQYSQPPPNYGGPPPPQPPQPNNNGDAQGKQSFDQAFKLQGPRYNDLWAGILVLFPPPSYHSLHSPTDLIRTL